MAAPGWPQTSESDDLVGIHVHNPETESSFLETSERQRHKSDHGRRGGDDQPPCFGPSAASGIGGDRRRWGHGYGVCVSVQRVRGQGYRGGGAASNRSQRGRGESAKQMERSGQETQKDSLPRNIPRTEMCRRGNDWAIRAHGLDISQWS